MKNVKRGLVLFVIILLVVVVKMNYPKLNIISGYSAKSMASSVFVANRTMAFTDSTDNNFSPIDLATDEVNLDEKSATASTLGLLTRKAIYREGLGTVLVTKGFDTNQDYLVPNRVLNPSTKAFPYGGGAPKDSVFAQVDYNHLNLTLDTYFDPSLKSRAILVVYKDHIIAEKYAKGFDEHSRFLGWSMTKSIMSTVYGIAQYQGILNVTERAPISAWQQDERKDITIHNLLQMNSGLEWDENYDGISDVTKMLFLEEDMTQVQASKSLVGKPNETWNYSSGTSNLLSGILRTKLNSHQTYLDYWYREFIDKIGMNSMLLEADLSGNYVGSSYSWATARDWAKFGLLYLHEGAWDGVQIFAPAWANYVATPTPTSDGQYGAQFWLNAENQFKDVPKNMYYADGYQGQRVYILPEQDLVIVRFGLENFNENDFLKNILKSIK